MNKTQREPWRGLARQQHHNPEYSCWLLCTFCRYGEAYSVDESECLHPIERKREQLYDDAVNGYDCWGFRPEGTIPEWRERLAEWGEQWRAMRAEAAS